MHLDISFSVAYVFFSASSEKEDRQPVSLFREQLSTSDTSRK